MEREQIGEYTLLVQCAVNEIIAVEQRMDLSFLSKPSTSRDADAVRSGPIGLLGDTKCQIEVRLFVITVQLIEIEFVGKVVMHDGAEGQTVGEVRREITYGD